MKFLIIFLLLSAQAFAGIIEIEKEQFQSMDLAVTNGIFCANILRVKQDKNVLWEKFIDNDYHSKWNLDVPQDSLKNATHIIVTSECADKHYRDGLFWNEKLTLNVQTTQGEKSLTTVLEWTKTSRGSTNMIKFK